ncbi:MAG: alpha/beta fold hydrolase [Pseudomonadota bacterium]
MTLFSYTRRHALAIAVCAFVTACQSPPDLTAAINATVIDTTVRSRGVSVPVTFVFPDNHGGQPVPLVLLIHGHGGTRHEAGGFTQVAQRLADNGIASIRMDFPGCGESTESWINNNLTNMLTDVRAAEAFAIARGNIDTDRIGLLGFSMGGRIALLLADRQSRYPALALWAPSATNGGAHLVDYLGGPASYRKMKEQARNQGFAPYTTFWGQDQRLGYQWFTDLEKSRPMDAVSRYRGDLFVLWGDLDTVVKPEIAEAVLSHANAARSRKRYVVFGADHGLGLFDGNDVAVRQTVDETATFLTRSLKR